MGGDIFGDWPESASSDRLGHKKHPRTQSLLDRAGRPDTDQGSVLELLVIADTGNVCRVAERLVYRAIQAAVSYTHLTLPTILLV